MSSNPNSSLPASSPGDRNKITRQVVAILAACLLLWLSFKGANLGAVLKYARCANINYICLLVLSALCSHILRSCRWLILLRPLTDKKISLWHSFCAIIYGYAVNIVIPRGGEIVRLISICKMEGLSWAGVLPTLLIDRLLDLVMLAFLLGFTLISLPSAQLANLPWIYPCGISLTASTIILFLLLPVLAPALSFLISMRWLRQQIPPAVLNKLNDLIEQFQQGTRSLTKPFTYPLIGFFTVAIWFCYWLNFYFVLAAFDLNGKLTVNKEIIIFAIGSVGALVPTPGCIGGFHFLVSQCLILIGGIDKNLALAFATVLHAFAFVIIISCAALICIVCQSILAMRAKMS